LIAAQLKAAETTEQIGEVAKKVIEDYSNSSVNTKMFIIIDSAHV